MRLNNYKPIFFLIIAVTLYIIAYIAWLFGVPTPIPSLINLAGIIPVLLAIYCTKKDSSLADEKTRSKQQ